ncbi:MAG: 4Fe-4S binding protein [Promethearchaeota archaeon]
MPEAEWEKINKSKDKRPKIQEYKSWEELPPIPISFPVKGSIGETGDWRTFRPVINREKCTDCGFCWMFCPEGVIDAKTLEIDYAYCKGCGICARECPQGAIEMVRESECED